MLEAQMKKTKDTTLQEYAQHLKGKVAQSEAMHNANHRDQLEQEDPARWTMLDESQRDMMVQEAREQTTQRIARRYSESGSDC
jgi:hypothetical protein